MEAENSSPAEWLVARFAPVSLFSLKPSFATSSVGTTLVVPTPYAIKMALVDAAFRAGDAEDECAALLEALVPIPVRIAPPEAVVTHTFSKIRQEPKKQVELKPYISNIAYREFAAFSDEWRWAFGLARESGLAVRLARLLAYVRYVGKRGSFVQFLGVDWQAALSEEFTAPLEPGGGLALSPRSHIVPLDDFGPEATLRVLSSFSSEKARRDRHRVFVDTVVPLGRARTGPGFTEYRR
jgi:hypothetical protein